MSVKRLDPLVDTPMDVSSNEEEEETEGNSSSEEEEDDESSLNPTVKTPETMKNGFSESDEEDVSESGSDEETDSDSGSKREEELANPVSSVVKHPAETRDLVVAENHDSKEGKISDTRKRSSETDVALASSADPKRVKRVPGEDEKKSGGGREETKKTYFQRVWSEEDEVAVLQGLINYKTDSGLSPYDDKDAFFQLVKKSISFDVSRTQFTKIRSLKKKFETNLGKGKNGEEPTFSKPHDRKAFDLSRLVWEANGMALESAVKSNGNSKKRQKVELVCEDKVANKGDSSLLGVAETDAFVKSVLVKSLARSGVDDLVALGDEDPNLASDGYGHDLLEVHSLSDEALLLDLGITIAANHTLGIKPNYIYFTCHDRARLRIPYDMDIYVFNLASKTINRLSDLVNMNLKDARWFLPL